MKFGNIKTYISSIFVLLISMSLTVSTLHSHNHIEWHHPKKHVDTGTCLMVDSTQCPICGYLFNADVPPPETVDVTISDSRTVSEPALSLVQEPSLFYIKGRSPPVLI